MKDIGKNIRQLRHQKGWSQLDVAKQLDISIPAFSKIETGVTDINLSRLEQIAGLFNLPTTALLNSGLKSSDTNTEMLLAVNNKLYEREMQLADLQKKVIELYEELKNTAVKI